MTTVQVYEVTKASESGVIPHPFIERVSFGSYSRALTYAVNREERSISPTTGKLTRLCAVIKERS